MQPSTLLFLALGLSADAAAASATRGLALPRLHIDHFASVALWFGGAQALMALLGGLLGRALGQAVAGYTHFIAFGLLCALGLKMLHEAYALGRAGDERVRTPFAASTMALLALATSIDALAVGLTLPWLGARLYLAAAVIGLVTALCSALGLVAGKRFGAALGQRVDFAGGLILIGLGAKILLEHLAQR